MTARLLFVTCCGCLSVAAQVQDPWTWTRNALQPSPAAGYSVAYHATRQRGVLFGGSGWDFQSFDETWEWDGHRWLERLPATVPTAREYAAMAWDPNRNQLLLFGGLQVRAQIRMLLNDTWCWDGTNWQQMSTPVAPPGRHQHRLATDPVRRRIVLFGGSNQYLATAPLQDTWEWDGQQWIQCFPATHVPTGKTLFGMAFNARTQRVAMFGGSAGFTRYSLLPAEEWDGNDWTSVSGAGGVIPGFFVSNGAVEDPTSGGVLIVGVVPPEPYTMVQYLWDGTRLTQVNPTGAIPVRRTNDTMFLDRARSEVVLYSGTTSHDPAFRETVAYDIGSSTWRQKTVVPGPGHTVGYVTHVPWLDSTLFMDGYSPPGTWLRSDTGFRYVCVAPMYYQNTLPVQPFVDPIRRRVWAYEHGLGTIWSFDGSAWTQLPGSLPTNCLVAGYDEARQLTWFVDYSPSAIPPFARACTWDGATWSVVSDVPGAGGLRGAVYDNDRRVLSLLTYEGVPLVREYDGANWTVTNAPANWVVAGGRYTHVPGFGCVLLSQQNAWVWDGSQWWTLPTVSGRRSGDYVVSATYDRSRRRIRALFSSERAVFEDLWDLHPSHLLANTVEPGLNSPLQFQVSAAGHAGEPWLLGLSMAIEPGIPLAGLAQDPYRVLPLAPDQLLLASAGSGLMGILDGQGRGQAGFTIPNNPVLVGFRFFAAALSVTGSFGIGMVSAPVAIDIMP